MLPATIQDTFSAVEKLGVAAIPDRVRSLPSRLERPSSGVAILGLVNRGKSTLFNRLVGDQLSPVAETPETAAAIVASSGPAVAHGRTADGKDMALPSQPLEFHSRARRHNGTQVAMAWIAGRFRMPPDLVLIDTPGVDDAAVDFEHALARLPDQWRDSGASAAVVVLSYPPGPSSRDRELIDHARAAFPGAVAVVLKATSSGIKWDDLQEVARDAEETLGLPVLLLPDELTAGPWGRGPYARLETEIDRIAELGARRLSADLAAFDRFLEQVLSSVGDTSAADIPAIAEVLDAHPSLPPGLKAALSEQQDRLTAARLEHQRRAEEVARSARLEVLERTAARLVPTLRSMQQHGDKSGAHRIYAEFVDLAKEGSPTAIAELLRVLESERTLDSAGLDLAKVLAALPDGKVVHFLANSSFGPEKLLQVLRASHLTPALRQALERRTLALLESIAANEVADLDSHLSRVTALADVASIPGVQLAAARLEQHLILLQLRIVTNVTIDSIATLKATKTAAQRVLARLQRQQERRVHVSAAEGQTQAILSDLAARAAITVRAELARRYYTPVIDPEEWQRQTLLVEQAAASVLEIAAPDCGPCELLREDLDRSRRGRTAWQRALHEASIKAKHEYQKAAQEASAVKIWAFVGLGFLGAGLFHARLGALGLLLGAVALTGLVWEAKKWPTPTDGSWPCRLHLPPPPVLAAPELPEAGWYRDPFTDQGRNRWWTGFHWTQVVSPPGVCQPTFDWQFECAVPSGWLPDTHQRDHWRWWTGLGWSKATRSWL